MGLTESLVGSEDDTREPSLVRRLWVQDVLHDELWSALERAPDKEHLLLAIRSQYDSTADCSRSVNSQT